MERNLLPVQLAMVLVKLDLPDFYGERVCQQCGGSGQIISDPCKTCGGEGRVQREND